ncbi:MAG TPA: class I SAM-dependent methyltransferase [Candidatus Limnocylindrales bacterium]|nr:class I SAM-dependent methyltransferase [Candidatus Limnocylindrales bacterium]
MSNTSLGMPDDLAIYVRRVGVREHPLLVRLRDETAALPEHNMQIAPEQGAFMALLVELMAARRCVEVGTFTGYSSLAVALALPADGHLTCFDVSAEWTSIARRYWSEAGVADKVELRLGPGLAGLDALITEGGAGTIDFAFVDADKVSYSAYHERILELLRPGGVVAYDNVFWGGRVTDPTVDDENVRAIRTLNEHLATDERVSIVMVPIGDGLTLARKR